MDKLRNKYLKAFKHKGHKEELFLVLRAKAEGEKKQNAVKK